MPAAKKNVLQRLRTIVKKLALGLTVDQACASVGVSDQWFYDHTKPGSAHSGFRAKAEAAMIEVRMRLVQRIEKDAYKDGDYSTALKAATWQLERIYRRQYGDERRGLTLNAQQNNYTLSEQKAKEIDERAGRLTEKLALKFGNGDGNGDTKASNEKKDAGSSLN